MSDHKGEDIKGRVKEAVGDITGDKGLKREGKIEQASAAAKDKIDEMTSKIKDVVNPKAVSAKTNSTAPVHRAGGRGCLVSYDCYAKTGTSRSPRRTSRWRSY